MKLGRYPAHPPSQTKKTISFEGKGRKGKKEKGKEKREEGKKREGAYRSVKVVYQDTSRLPMRRIEWDGL